jgi:hypothetical protein
LLLIIDGVTPQRKRQVAVDLLTATCCKEDGLSGPLQDMARAAYPLCFESQVAFILSSMVALIILTWADSLSISIFNLECGNEVLGKMRIMRQL